MTSNETPSEVASCATPATSPASISPLAIRRIERERGELHLFERMFSPEQPADAATSRRLRLTAEGLDYYGAWWRRFGFRLAPDDEGCVDGEVFFDTWQFIHRSQSGLPESGLFTETDLAAMPPAQRALGQALNDVVNTGAEPAGLEAMAQAARDEWRARSNVVTPLEAP